MFFRNTINGDFMCYYFNMFFINSFLGFLLETSLKYFVFHGVNNGILFGPWIPVYGFGAVIITFFGQFFYHKLKLSKLWKTIFLFFVFFLLLSLLEWVGGVLIEFIFHKEFWNYRNQKYNIGPYISLAMSLFWSFLSIIFFYFLLPLEEQIIKKIPRWFSILVLLLIVIDCILTCFVNF